MGIAFGLPFGALCLPFPDVGMSRRYRERLELLRVWARKGKLAPDSGEARELESLAAAEEADVDPVLEVAPVVEDLPLLGMESREAQAKFYGVSLRTIGLWRKQRAPLGRPSEMVGWWGRAFPGRPINVKILEALTKGPRGPEPVVAVEEPVALEPMGEVVEMDVGVGFDHAHHRMLQEEARLYARITRLEAAGRPEEADVLRTAWVKLSDSLGSADTKQIRNSLARGDLIQRNVIEKEFASLMRHFPEVLRAELKNMRIEVAPTVPAGEWDTRIDLHLDKLFGALPEVLMAAVVPQAVAA